MLSVLDHDLSGQKLIVFGSQALSFDTDAASLLRAQLKNEPQLGWVQNELRQLPELWNQICQRHPELQRSGALQWLENFGHWLDEGELSSENILLPNVMLTPLVVVTHLVEYFKLLQGVASTSVPENDVFQIFNTSAETFGQCTGILTAAALSLSHTVADVERYGSIVIRLAMLIGAIVDAQESGDTTRDYSKSLLVSWPSSQSDDILSHILRTFPTAYISVKVDKYRATVTTAGDSAQALQEHLIAAGFVVTVVNLRGCFHCEGRHADLDLLMEICDHDPSLQLPDAAALARPLRTDLNGNCVQRHDGQLHKVAAQSMLIQQADWYVAFQHLMSGPLASTSSLLVCIGPECYIPRNLMHILRDRLVQAAALHYEIPETAHDGVAVIGMACKVPGADDLEGYWQLLCDAASQHSTVPHDRFSFETSWRNSRERQWYGNFLNDYDAFDHKFFKKSPREIASADPQHRLMLQVAYQAVEQSGYFRNPDSSKHTGCYIGVANADYESNINCYDSNAYSATGNLKSFTSGKISHYFGWTGPSLAIDTACSASAVAVHYACKAILTGECSSALAGGVNVMTTPNWFYNLSGASFLSPTGQCKPFDSKADGYCRGEGVGAVFLKKLSSAIRDGDQILGVIKASAVFQNENCTPITVPNAPSLSKLLLEVVQQAHMTPAQVSYVEAHAPGTQIGDPAEYAAVSEVIGSPDRTDCLYIGSAKGVIGHAECASGILALIKVLLMVQKGVIPPQAGLHKLNPAIKLVNIKMKIASNSVPWRVNHRNAIINNFGASGSNVSLLVTQAPRLPYKRSSQLTEPSARWPFIISAADPESVRAYCEKFVADLQINQSADSVSIPELSYQVSKRYNSSLDYVYAFTSSCVDDLQSQLQTVQRPDRSSLIINRSESRPVILCFGGQVSTFVGLSRVVHDRCATLRRHLEECNNICIANGLDGIYPYIFQTHEIGDLVKLQTVLFSMQYACAKTWIDCGVKVAAVVGLSFGEFSALCISGALSLEAAVRMVIKRAELIRDKWSHDNGSMIAVEGDIGDVQKLLDEANKVAGGRETACIACYNSSRNFTLAGSTRVVGIIAEVAAKNSNFASLACRKLSVTHAFHSALADPILKDLSQITEEIPIKEPSIYVERATEVETYPPITSAATFLVDHIRQPSYYDHAVRRLAQQFPQAVWLESGSNSSIASLTKRALNSPSGSCFQYFNLSGSNALSSLADATKSLWREGLHCTFWLHHSFPRSILAPFLVPPYQFNKTSHWMKLKIASRIANEPIAKQIEHPPEMWTFLGYDGKDKRSAKFKINTKSQKYLDHIIGHKVAQAAPICSSTVQIEIAIETLRSLREDFQNLTYLPELCGMENMAPMVLDHTRDFILHAEATDSAGLHWQWEIHSTKAKTASSLHAKGSIFFSNPADIHTPNDFAKYERLITRDRCTQLLSATDAEEVMQGRGIFKAFRDILEYGEMYKGLKKLVSKGIESAGTVEKQWDGESYINSGLLDSFCQVAGMFVNNSADKSDDEMYISNGIDHFIRSPRFYKDDMRSERWDVFSSNHRASEKEFISDVFIFDARTGILAEVILGIKYVKVSRTGLGKMILRLTPDSNSEKTKDVGGSSMKSSEASRLISTPEILPTTSSTAPSNQRREGGSNDSLGGHQPHPTQRFNTTPEAVTEIIANLSGLDMNRIKPDSTLAELGIDSLMGMELAREFESFFDCSFSAALLVDFLTLADLVEYLQKNIGGLGGTSTDDNSVTEVDESDDVRDIDRLTKLTE